MKKGLNNSELIDAYLEGQLSADEVNDFEGRLEKDPLLKHELHRKEELIRGIQQFRHAQLKSQLSEVNISLAKIKLLNNLKISGIVAAASLTGIAAYFYLNQPAEPQSVAEPKVEVAIEQPQSSPSDLTVAIPEARPEAEPQTEEEAQNSLELPQEQNEQPVAKVDPIENTPLEETTGKAENLPVVEAPEVNMPQVSDQFGDQFNTSLGNQADLDGNLSARRISEDKRFDISTSHENGYDFHYQFKGNSLVLLGDFSQDTYEILEIIEQDIHKVYLYYQGDFYALDSEAQEVQPLTPIQNPKLINTLYNLRKEKTL